MNTISSDIKITKKIICYSRRNDFTKFLKISLSINKRKDKTEITQSYFSNSLIVYVIMHY